MNYIQQKDPYTKLSKNLLLEPQALPPFSPILIDNYDNPSKATISSSINRYNSLPLFSLFFTNKILYKIASQINTFIKAYPILERIYLGLSKNPSCLYIYRQELYIYFRVIFYTGIIIELVVEDYQGPIKKGAIYKVTNYILKD